MLQIDTQFYACFTWISRNKTDYQKSRNKTANIQKLKIKQF